MTGPRRPPAGTPCLSALRTTDVRASVDFYAALFGWTPVPAAPNGFVIMMLDELPVAGVGPVFDPAHDVRWCTYIAAPAVDRTARAVEAAGGTVPVAPFDVPGIARVGVALDPDGAEVWLWQPYAFVGAEVAGTDRAVGGRVLTTPDADRARSFYSTVFGWTSADEAFRLAGLTVGEVGRADGDVAAWTPVVTVDDPAQTSARARALGASVDAGEEHPGTRMMRDPLGAALLIRATSE